MNTENHNDTPLGALTAREVCQVLREVVLGRRTMTKVGNQSWEQLCSGQQFPDTELSFSSATAGGMKPLC
ncbi:hypothetical protein H4C44_08645 [Pseudomonas juntendi]|uniref:DUF7693 domain-containing protein n=1 Tax=Pseudomonas juntendi TaxID=2666183 RepID=A0A7W2PSI2_9PSED|nr:hypothetical protein [Pseudomonas juntendi]MBA6126412.1 hypothetical protein [Pseudomonas juntendi]